MNILIFLKDYAHLIVLFSSAFFSGYYFSIRRYKGKILSFLEFFKEGDVFVLEEIICSGTHLSNSVFAFRRARTSKIFKRVKSERIYHVSGFEGTCFFERSKNKFFEKGIIYRVIEVWHDPGSVPGWHFYFEIPEVFPDIEYAPLSYSY